jgi:hypothetical protein
LNAMVKMPFSLAVNIAMLSPVNGMDAPTRNGIECAKVERSSTT